MGSRFRFWTWWLTAVAAGALAFGLSVVVFPQSMARLFGGLYLSDPGGIARFGPEASAYVAFVTAVMGAVMAGWATALLCLLALRFRPGNPDAWWLITLSVIAWFIPDTAFSLKAGFWQNIVLNVVALVLLAVPLAATFGASRTRRAHVTSASG